MSGEVTQARQRGVALKKAMLQASGGPLSPRRVAAISIERLLRLRERNLVFSVSLGTTPEFPAFQFRVFSPEGRGAEIIPGLDRVLAELTEFDPWMKLLFFTTPDEKLGKRTPIAALRAGMIAEVVAVAATFGEQGAR